jgi:hypothetical protein
MFVYILQVIYCRNFEVVRQIEDIHNKIYFNACRFNGSLILSLISWSAKILLNMILDLWDLAGTKCLILWSLRHRTLSLWFYQMPLSYTCLMHQVLTLPSSAVQLSIESVSRSSRMSLLKISISNTTKNLPQKIKLKCIIILFFLIKKMSREILCSGNS